MTDILIALLIGLLCLFAGYGWGWQGAHVEIARECERLGGFYVGGKVFECKLKEPK